VISGLLNDTISPAEDT